MVICTQFKFTYLEHSHIEYKNRKTWKNITVLQFFVTNIICDRIPDRAQDFLAYMGQGGNKGKSFKPKNSVAKFPGHSASCLCAILQLSFTLQDTFRAKTELGPGKLIIVACLHMLFFWISYIYAMRQHRREMTNFFYLQKR